MKQLWQPLLFGFSLFISMLFAISAINEHHQAAPKSPYIEIVSDVLHYEEPMPRKLFTNNNMASVSRADAPGEIETPMPPSTNRSRQNSWQPTWP